MSWLLLACATARPPAAPAEPPSTTPPVASIQPSASSTPAPRERPYEYDDPTRDTDNDGIVDPEDHCPADPGKPNRIDYKHGCPTTIDLMDGKD
jgi:OmpA-OmpF porin, OOP family